MEDNKPEGSDAELEELFQDEASQEDVADKGDDKLSLGELNNIFGREFKTKEEAIKHAESLKSFAGDQEAIKERKAQKELESKKKEDVSVKEELASLKKDLAKKDFLIETPTAKDYIDVVEAYAEKNSISISEAWNSEKFKPIAEASQRTSKTMITNNRITPVQTPKIQKLAEQVKETGSDEAKTNLVKEYFK